MRTVREKVDDALRHISSALEMDLALNSQGLLVLDCEGGATCTIEVPLTVEGAFIYVSVSPVTPTTKADVVVLAMELNAFQLRPLGAWLGLDASKDMVFLCYRVLEQELEGNIFADLLFALIESARLLRDNFSNTQKNQKRSYNDKTPIFDDFLGSIYA